jgi:HAD superfamily hydrolase (TIGR01509 family)
VLDVRAIIFDMDGLMVDSEPLWWRVEKELASAHGKRWTDEMALSCIGTGLPNTIRTMRAELGIDLGDAEGVAWLVDRFIASLADLALKPGLLELVEAGSAAGLPLAVASSSTRRLIEAVLARFELTPRFVTVAGDEVANAKPAPDIFLAAAAKLATAPADCVVLEDSLAGVRAAVAAAIPVIAVPEGDPTPFQPLTPHVVTDLHQARRLLRWG